jgi:hypothetical protein
MIDQTSQTFILRFLVKLLQILENSLHIIVPKLIDISVNPSVTELLFDAKLLGCVVKMGFKMSQVENVLEIRKVSSQFLLKPIASISGESTSVSAVTPC